MIIKETAPIILKKHSSIRILIVGIDCEPNRVTRAVQRYGCDYYHVNGDPNNSYPKFCDAAIIVLTYTGHDRYYRVKEVYDKQLARPIFYMKNGFTEIQEKFERWLKEKRGFVLPPEAAKVGELTVPKAWLEAKSQNKTKEVEMTKETVRKSSRYDPSAREKIHAIMKEEYEKGTPSREVAERLNAEGCRKTTGAPFTPTDVAARRVNFRRAAGCRKALKSRVGAPLAQAPSIDKDLIKRFTLAQQVTLSTTLTPEQKDSINRRIFAGEDVEPEKIEVVEVDGNLILEKTLLFENRRISISMSRDQVALLLACSDKILEFHKKVNT